MHFMFGARLEDQSGLITVSGRSNTDDILVLGVGNPLMGDDGVGIRAAELLSESDLPSNVNVEKAGLPGWGLANWFENKSHVILVDAVKMGAAPGSWKCFDIDEFRFVIESNTLSLHQNDLACGLALAQALDLLPQTVNIYGVEPSDLSAGGGLSPEVNASLPELVRAISKNLEKKIE